jgi:hypothetical protein
MGNLFVYLGIFFSGGVAQTLVWNRITSEVNQRLPDSEQYSISVWALRRSARGPFNQFKIWQLHRQFFRDSNLRLLFLATLVLTILWMFLGLTILNALAPS